MSKGFEQFRCNSATSARIGKSGLTKKAKAYARKCAYELAKQHNPERTNQRQCMLPLVSLFVWYDSPQGKAFWEAL